MVLAVATVLVTLPTNLLTTFQSPRFVTYMGTPESDLRADVQFSDAVDAVHEELLTRLEGDDRVTRVRDFGKVLYETPGEEGWEVLRVEVGDHSRASVQLLEGATPGDGEIALSVANAERFGLSPGETMPLRRGGGDARGAVVSGVYPAALAREYEESVPSATVIPMREYVEQTLSYVTDALRRAAVLAGVFGVGVVLLITTLLLRLRLARERARTGVLTAMGFSSREIGSQVRLKVALSVVAGAAAGVVRAATAGGALALTYRLRTDDKSAWLRG